LEERGILPKTRIFAVTAKNRNMYRGGYYNMGIATHGSHRRAAENLLAMTAKPPDLASRERDLRRDSPE